MSVVGKIFRYLEPLWLGADGKISKNAVIAMILSYNFIENINWAIHKWEASRSFEGLSLIMGIEAGLITALLGLTAWSNMTAKKIDSEALSPQEGPNVIVQRADNVTNSPTTTTTKAEVVNAEKVDTVNSGVTNVTNSKEPIDAK